VSENGVKAVMVSRLLTSENKAQLFAWVRLAYVAVVQPAGAEIAPDAYLPFTINFMPRASRTYTATVTIRSNDASGDHVFTITATGVSPRPIATNASWVSIEDNEYGLFAVTGQPSTALNVVPGGITTFTIRYIPEATGAASATV